MTKNETLSVRRTPFYLFLILLGFLIFYVFDFLRGHGKEDVPMVPTTADKIDPKVANELINNYLASQDSIGKEYRLLTNDGLPLRGFWLSKEMLARIDEEVKQSGQACAGYSLYFVLPK